LVPLPIVDVEVTPLSLTVSAPRIDTVGDNLPIPTRSMITENAMRSHLVKNFL
jgi:hypothetical protein